MFTLSEIKEAHSKVKSGADFPAYVQALIALGVKGYTTFVHDGHTEYCGDDNYKIATPPVGVIRAIATAANNEQFKKQLVAHQQGYTNYPTFCNDAAATGVEKWVVDTTAMTCSYYDLEGNAMLVEKIGEIS